MIGFLKLVTAMPGRQSSIQIHEDYKSSFIELIKSEKKISVTIEFSGTIISTSAPGIITMLPGNIEIKASKEKKEKTRKQQNLLRAIERLIFFADNNREAMSSEINNIHEALLELYAPRKPSPLGDGEIIVRTGDPELTTKGMARIIWGAWNELCMLDIPKEVSDAIGNDLKNVWEAVKDWKYNKFYEIFREIEKDFNEKKYRIANPVCEFCGRQGTVEDPLVRIHLLSKGADVTTYENPRYYIIGHDSIHKRIHATGWSKVLIDYPHIKRRYDDAHTAP